jgi:hypothetical protein
MEPSLELIEELEREDIEQARRMSSTEKLRAGDMFEEARRWMLADIRADFPGINDEAAQAEFIRRLDSVLRVNPALYLCVQGAGNLCLHTRP